MLEHLFVEHRPSGDADNRYYLVPRSSNEVRQKLFEFVLNDPSRRRVAFAMLGQIAAWRLEYGRPTAEPRHPMFRSGVAWPPLEVMNGNV